MGERFGLSTYLAVGIPQTRERSSNYPYIRKQSSICHACWWLGKTDRQMQKLPVGYWNSNAPALNQLARAEVVGHIFIGNKWLLPTQTMHYPTENGPKLPTILMNVYRLISPNIGNTVPAEHETPAALLNVISEMGPEHVASASNKGNDGRDLLNGNPWHTAIYPTAIWNLQIAK